MATSDEAVSRVVKDFEGCQTHHTRFTHDVEKRYKAFRGKFERRSEAASWTNKYHPPYLMHIVETSIAAKIEERTKFKVWPLPRLISSPDEAETLKQGAEAHEILLGWQMLCDRFHEKQRPFVLQEAITGLSVAKVYWRTDERDRKRRRERQESVAGSDGMPLGLVTSQYTAEERSRIYDGPTFEVRDVRDWFWPESAISLDKAPYVIDRCWYTFDELKALEALGIYENVDQLKESNDFSDEQANREMDMRGIDRTKGLIEVLEHWTETHVTTVGNRKVKLRSRKNPFWHGRKPFVTFASQPDLFSIPGISQVEKVDHLQEMMWNLQCQTLDNLQLINNQVTLIRSDSDDPDQFKFEPGARWLVDDPGQVVPYAPNPLPAQVAQEMMGLIKGDMQNLSGGYPFVSGTDSQSFDQKTATGAAIVTNVAQKSLVLQKAQLSYALERAGQLMVELNQQFVTEPVLAQVVGVDDELETKTITPLLLQGDFLFRIDAAGESVMRQERRAEAQAMLQMALSAAPVFAAAAQQGMATPLNLNAFMDDFLESYDVVDRHRYYSSAPAAPMPASPGQGAPTEQAAGAPDGVTAPQSISPDVSPSNQVSMAPTRMMQRLQAVGNGG